MLFQYIERKSYQVSITGNAVNTTQQQRISRAFIMDISNSVLICVGIKVVDIIKSIECLLFQARTRAQGIL